MLFVDPPSLLLHLKFSLLELEPSPEYTCRPALGDDCCLALVVE